ncbi:MAG: hypothetical protein K2J90_08300 [Lachnospiraceae bacterium]|nr:hypothetical protein [Lachnospiraceae bacterium]
MGKEENKTRKSIWLVVVIVIVAVILLTGMLVRNMKKAENAVTLNNPKQDSDGVVTWDCVYFGSYPQSDDTGENKEPIKWRVLSVDGEDAFLIADTNLDVRKYNNMFVDVTWETCTLRSWLNGYGSDSNECGTDCSSNNFINQAFTDSEQKAIKQTTVVNTGNSFFDHIDGGRDTQDKIFLLSYDEAANPDYGFLIDNARKRENTAYAEKIFVSRYDFGGVHDWWLRSPGGSTKYAIYVNFYGEFRMNEGVRFDCGVCPALHLDLSFTDVWSYAGMVNSNGEIIEEENLSSEEEESSEQ